jgi:hypothetical protein
LYIAKAAGKMQAALGYSGMAEKKVTAIYQAGTVWMTPAIGSRPGRQNSIF